VFLAPLLLEGNLQYFFFLLFTQISRGFSLNRQDQVLTVMGYLLHFLVLWLAIVSCFLAFYLHRKLTKYILDNWRSSVRGLLSYFLVNAIRMLVFGALHSLLRDHPAQLPSLMLAEAIFVVFLVSSMRRLRAHRAAFKVWFTVGFALLRMALQLSLLVQQMKQVVGTGTPEETLFDSINGFLLTIYVGSFYLGTLWGILFEIIEALKPHKHSTKNQLSNNIKVLKPSNGRDPRVKQIRKKSKNDKSTVKKTRESANSK
jgi:hypothetical protein